LNKPRFYYGYVIVIVSFIIMMLSWGVFYIYGVFFSQLIEEFNWTRAVTSGAFSMSILVSGVMGIFAGRLSDRLGPKKVIIFCAVILSLGYALMALVHTGSLSPPDWEVSGHPRFRQSPVGLQAAGES
jgi:MFS family permease